MPNGSSRLRSVVKFGGYVFQRKHGVKLQLRFEVGQGQAGSGIGVEVRGQLFDIGGGQRGSRRRRACPP